MRQFVGAIKFILAVLGFLAFAVRSQSQESAPIEISKKIPAVQALFEEAAELSEILATDRHFIFVGVEAGKLYRVFQVLARKDALSPQSFALTGRIHWVPSQAAYDAIAATLEKAPLEILSSSEAEKNKIVADCQTPRGSTKVWVINLSSSDDDCLRERFLEAADRPWTSVTLKEIEEFAATAKHEKFYALKRRLWRHIFLMLETDLPKEAFDTIHELLIDPTNDPLQKAANEIMAEDFWGLVLRYFPKHFEALSELFKQHCQGPVSGN